MFGEFSSEKMVDFVRGYSRARTKMDSINLDNNLESLLDLDFNFMRDMSMDIAPTLITLYDSVAANGQADEHPEQGEEDEEEEERLRPQQDCRSRDQEEPIAFVPSSTTLAAPCLRDSEGSLIAVDDVTQENEGKCSNSESSDYRGREGCESPVVAEDRLKQIASNHSFLHATGGSVPLVGDSASLDSYLDRTPQENHRNAQNGGEGNSDSSANILEPSTPCGKVRLHGGRDNNFNVEHSSRMVSSDNPGENMAIDLEVDFNSNSNNDCRPRAQSADLLSDSRRWSQRQRPASAEITTSDYLNESGACSPVLQQKHDEVAHCSHTPIRQNSSRINPPIIVTTTALTNEAMSPPTSPPTSPPMSPTFNKRPKSSIFSVQGRTYLDRIVDEIIETERSYVSDLGDIIKGYNQAMKHHPGIRITKQKFDTLFCNLEDIHSFNRELLADLEQCDEDPVKLADCFLEVEDEFRIYTTYCTNYPKAVDVLTECMQDPAISDFFREQQAQLNHGLALGAYLLKPVQRILKYHLLFQDMMKHYKEEHGRDVIARALKSMTNVAWHINDMKRKHEASVHVQEIQSQLHGWQDDLNSYGDLVLEDVMRMHGARGDRFIYLFERALLIGKKHENTNLISIKTQITCANLMLIESVPKEPLGFNVIPFDNSDLQYTIIAKSPEQKKQWTHEIKRLILENYQSNIPTKVKELILGTKATKKTHDDLEADTKASPQDPTMSRDRKERKSRKKHKRRNSEPMGKLQRGQKQVKAAVENIIIGMKRPDLSKLGTKRSTDHAHEDGTEDSYDEVETNKAGKSEPCTPHEKGESLAPLARPEEMRDDYGAHQDTRQDSSPSSSKKLVLSKSLGDKKESNRDSGIGSMNLSEHLKLDSEDKSSADEAKVGDGRMGKKKGGAVRKLENGMKRRDGLDDEEGGAEGGAGESPDELEALEQLSDDNHLVVDPLLDIELSPKPSRRSLSTIHGPELFKLRRVDLKEYRPLNDRFSKDHDDVWVPMTSRHFRNRSFSHIPSRPQSADVTTHPHFQKLRLSRTRSDDSSLHAWAEMAKCRSDPNITDHKSDLGDSIKSSDDKQHGLGSSASTFGTVDGDFSSLSSHENLEDSINIAFQKLGAKYAAKSDTESGHSTPHNSEEKAKDSNAASSRKEKVSIILNDEDVLKLDKDDTESSHQDKSTETCSAKDDDDTSADSPEEEELNAVKKKVQRLARKYSKMIKHQQEQPSTIVVTRKSSESSSSEADGKQVAWAVTHSQCGTIIKRFEIDSSSGVRRENSLTRSTTTTDSEDSSSSSRRSITRSSKNRKSVRDFVRKFEVTKPTKPEPKVVTPVQDGIKERLKSFQQEKETRPANKSPQHRSSMGFKKLSERRKELEDWVSKPKSRSRHNSEGKDSVDGLSYSSSCSASEAGDFSFTFNSSYQGSYASSLHSSGRSSPCIEARMANINAIKEGLLESISRLTPHTSAAAEEEEVTPAMFKSIRERFEELEKAAHKPIPRTVSDPHEEIKGNSTVDDEDTLQDLTDIQSAGDLETSLTPLTLDIDLPFPEVFDTSSSELSAGITKSSESQSLNNRLDALDISSENSASDGKQFSSSSDLLFPEIEKIEVTPSETCSPSNSSVSNVKVTKTKLSDSCHQVSLEISLTSKKRESAHPTTLDVLSLYEGLSTEDALAEEHKMLSPEPALNRSSSESSYKDALSANMTSPLSEDYVTAPEDHC